ncbi:uncharacterized protein Y057_2938 [Fusarium fujikuroi]|nr:uncharacterized protein Y057_2938 [Fusarium fujikuroi]
MLEQLPQEIFDFILNLLSMDDVKNLSLTSKHLHSATLEAVWESIVIPAWNKNEECEKDYWKSFRNMYTGKVPRDSDRPVRLYPSPGYQLERTEFRKSQNIGHCA